LRAEIRVFDAYGTSVFRCDTATDGGAIPLAPPHGKLVCHLRDVLLVPGQYRVSLALADSSGPLDRVEKAATFTVIHGGATGLRIPPRHWGSVVMRHTWDLTPAEASGLVERALG
jgi:hypothetical protein